MKHTDHRQNQTQPGEGDIDNTGPPEGQLRTLNKLTNEPPKASAQGTLGDDRGKPQGQHMWVRSQGTDTHLPVWMHTEHTHAQKCAYLLQHVHTSEGGLGGRQLPAPHPLKGGGSDRSIGPEGHMGSPMPGPLHFREEERGLPTAQGGRLWFGSRPLQTQGPSGEG